MRFAKYAQQQLEKAAEYVAAGNRSAARDAAERAVDALSADDEPEDEDEDAEGWPDDEDDDEVDELGGDDDEAYGDFAEEDEQ